MEAPWLHGGRREKRGCRCTPPDRSRWRVVQRNCNHSAFSGYRWTPSAYSGIRCLGCGAFWRTKAQYVGKIKDVEGDEGYRVVETDEKV